MHSNTMQSKKGFTLVELLIVIALLGALAVGLLAALDPFEQLRKGTDTGVRNTTAELQGAVIRYYAIRAHMPWCDLADITNCQDPTGQEANTWDADNTITDPIANIIATGELKQDFEGLASTQLPRIRISGTSDPATVQTCFRPESRSFQSEPNTRFDENAAEITDGTCLSQGGTAQCYWCLQ